MITWLITFVFFPLAIGVAFTAFNRVLTLEDQLRRLNKHIESVKTNDRLDAELVKRMTDSYKRLESQYKELRSNVALRVASKGPSPEWSVMSYDDTYAALEVSKMDLNKVIEGERYEDNRFIITLLDADDVNSRHLDFQCMLEQTESTVSKLRETVEHLKEQTTLADVREDWDHWECRIRDAISTALQDSDFIERTMDDLHSEMLEHLTNE